jgi:hypothetical protein
MEPVRGVPIVVCGVPSLAPLDFPLGRGRFVVEI